MPFNKGDFTQQGVAGDVSALVRLNEKRVMKVVLSSDDESDNCDISGAVVDLLNNEVYPIGAGVSGNIEITENGENINVAPYATATVNVAGGGGVSLNKLTLNITNSAESTRNLVSLDDAFSTLYGTVIIDNMVSTEDLRTSVPIDLAPGDSASYDIYYDYLSYTTDGSPIFIAVKNSTTVGTLTNITYVSDYSTYIITDATADSVMNVTVLVGK